MEDSRTRWKPATRVAFRFLFPYFVLFSLTGHALRVIPFSEPFIRAYVRSWHAVIVWLDAHLLHTGYDFRMSDYATGGVSNAEFGWVLFLCYVALSAGVAALWSVLDRRRGSYERLHAWFRLLLRFSLGLTLIHYGAIKVIPSQMIAPPPLGLLLQRVGELSPMRMLWIFMGSSPAYESFTGMAEMAGGLLLLLPRTTLLGALLCAADMTMVVVLNFSYDVHVKLLSMNLLAMALVLAAPDARRLAGLFLFNRTVEPARTPPLSARPWLARAPHILLLLLGLYAAGKDLVYARERYEKFHPPRPPLYGAWSVDRFEVDGREVPMETDPERWRWILFGRPGGMMVKTAIDSNQGFIVAVDTRARTLKLRRKSRPGDLAADFTFTEPGPDLLTLEGRLDGRAARLALSRMPLDTTERFHWIFIPPEDER
ncbi:MAG: hypothetical protein ACJ75H_13840 [Thermoanaerobaculia bacterium]